MILREQIIETARTWIDTPFHHQARLKGVGVDCVGLIIGVSKELGLMAQDFDVGGYPRVPDGSSFIYAADKYLVRIPDSNMQIGDAVIVSFDKDPQHVGLVGNYRHGGFSIIHASSEAGRVIETRLMFSEHMKYVASFSLPGV